MIPRAIVIALAAMAVGIAIATSDGVGGSSGGRPAGSVRLDFVYSTDTADLLEPLIERFNESGQDAGGRDVVVEGRALPSGVAATAIAAKRLRPVIWGPASTLWGRLLNHDAGAAWVADQNPSLVRSPQVIAIWEPLARALGWPRKPIGWHDILALATDPRGWASVGRPHYGRFKLGHTNPNSSTSGLSAVAAMYYALGGGLTARDVARSDVRVAVRKIERSIVHYGETVDGFLDQMARYGPDYAHAVAAQEASLVEFNGRRMRPRLVAVYPDEGTFVADYPFIVLRSPWVDGAERQAAGRFHAWLAARITPRLAARYAYRAPGAPVVQSPVDAAHGADPDQPEAVLQSPAPEVLAEIRRHWNADRKAANVVLVVDTSGTMGRRGRLARVQAGLQDFVDRLRPRDRVGLVTFASQVSTPVPLAPLGDHEADLRQAIREVVPSGRSALYDAVRAGFASVRALDDTTRINAVVVVADGADDSSASTLAGLARELSGACSGEEAALPVITVAYGADADRKALARIAGACQGRALSAAPGDVEETLRAVSLLF